MVKSGKILFLLDLIISLLCVSAEATQYYVSTNGDDDANGLSWATACETINGAIGKASNGDIIDVNEGTYYETVDPNGKNVTLTSTNPENWGVVEATIIDANGAGYGVDYHSGEDSNSILKGFTIRNAASYGIRSQSSSEPVISNCILKNNSYGFHCLSTSPALTRSMVFDNTYAGVLLEGTGSCIIGNNLIYDNGYNGIDTNNTGSGTIIRNNTICGSSCAGIKHGAGTQPTIINCIIWDCNDDLVNCSATYSCIQDGDSGTGNTSSDPCFVDADAGDFRLLVDSNCIDAANGNSAPDTDISGFMRFDVPAVDNTGSGTVTYADIGACEYQWSSFGMAVESVVQDGNDVIVTTTGATYVLSRTGMDMYRRIDPATNDYDPCNDGKGRKVAELDFNGVDIGALSIDGYDSLRAIVESTKATFEFQSDSFFFITAKDSLYIKHTNLIANAPWNAPLNVNDRDLDRMWTDGYGGSLLASVSEDTKGVLVGPNDVNYTKVALSTGDQTAHMVFPPKKFDFENLYGANARPFTDIQEYCRREIFMDDPNFRNGLVDDGFGVLTLWNDVYENTWEPSLLVADGNILGYKISDANLDEVEDFMDLAHTNDFNIVSYLFQPASGDGYGTWWYPAGHPQEGNRQDVAITLKSMRKFQAEHGFDGWYLDGSNCGHIIKDYNFMRQLRTDVGDKGIIVLHNSGNAWDQRIDPNTIKYTGLTAIMIDTYVNQTWNGESNGVTPHLQNLVDSVTDLYFRFITAGYGMSQAYSSHIYSPKGAPSNTEWHRLLAENLNGCQINRWIWWENHFKPAYEVRKAEYADANTFNPDVNWPIDPNTGWFRTPTNVQVTNISGDSATISWTTDADSNSAVAYTSNEIWWPGWWQGAPTGPDGTVSDSNMVTSHSITLTGLNHNTTYEYRIRSNNGDANIPGEIIWGYVGTFSPLISHWKFDDGSGTNADDCMSGYDGNIVGPSWVSGYIGSALSFDGSNDYVTMGDNDDLDFGQYDSFTITAWIKTTASSGAIVEKRVPGYYPYYGYTFMVSDGKLYFEVHNCSNDGDYFTATGTADVNDGKWHHVAAVRDGGYELRIYVDGKLDGYCEEYPYGVLENSMPFRVGYSDTYDSYFNGQIDDIRLYNYAIEFPTGIVSRWKLDETTGFTAYDCVSDNDGTLTNGPTPVSGYMGGALSFDGSNDYVTMGDVSAFDFGTGDSFTISAWIKTDKTSGTAPIVGKFSGIGYVFMVYNGKAHFEMDDGTWLAGITGQTNIADANWHHVAVVRDVGEDKFYIYVDGEPDATPRTDESIASVANSGNFKVGYADYTASCFDGVIDDVRVYNSALDEDNIEDIFLGNI